MSQLTSHHIGRLAETWANQFLTRQGWTIVARNYKTPYGEIDLLAVKHNILAAFEVKRRNNIDALYYSITSKQQNRIANSLLHFLSLNRQYDKYVYRFDALLIHRNTIFHLENAWSYNE